MTERTRFVALVVLVVLVVLVIPAFLRPALRAQESGQQLVPVVVRAVGFAISPPISELPPDEAVKPEDVASDSEAKSRPIRTFRVESTEEGSPDEGIQTFPAPEVLPGPSLSFEGSNSADNAALFGFRLSPPDTDGDVGPNHYVQMINLVIRMYDKAGNPLTPPRKLSSIFAALGAPCGTADDGDPIALYDPLADRWLLSQFCTVANPNNHQLVAISQTGDPTGSYYLYDFMMPNNKFNDYPKFGVWPDGYYMTDNQFNQAGTAFLGGGMFAFDRAKMLVGDPTASFIYFDTCPTSTGCAIGGMLPSDVDGLNPPPVGTPNYFSTFDATEFGDPADALRVWEFHADFANPANSTFTERPESPIPVAAFDPRSPAGRDDIEQPPPSTSTSALDSISDRLMFRLAYRNFGGYESLVVNHTVNVGTGTTLATHQAGVRYYELRRALPAGPFGVNEQATFAPDTDNRWMGSAAMDNQGNLAVGYSVSSLTTFPSIRYAGRLASDPPNGLFQGETTLIAGTGVQRDTGSRWGDYSALAVDPSDDCTFWFTTEYYTAASQATSTVGWLTRIGTFSFPACTPGAKATIQGTVTNAVTGLPIAGAVVQTSGGYLRTTDALGHYSMTVIPGSHDMTASKPTYGPDSALGVAVANGGTTIQDFQLNPTPIITGAGASAVSGESCSPATSAIDPGETISVSLAVQNIGSADTVDLVATLLPTGGVTSPSGPESYGAVLVGGPSVSRSFTFTADSASTCGGTLTATLSLQDGASSLGTVSYTFTLGALGAPVSGTYTTGNIAVPIPDVSSVEIPISVPDTGSVTDINVRIRLNHTFDGDLEIRLVHPDGTAVMLSDNRGGGGDNFGTGSNDCSGTHTVFDDSAATAIASGIAPFAGSFRPDQPLSGLNGKPSDGTWKLRITDTAAIDVGSVGCVQLEIARRQYLCCPFTGGAPSIAAVPPAVITSESCGPANGAPDPDETVTVSFPLQDIGTGPTTDLVATLLPGGGVNAPSAPQSYGLLSPVGPAVSRSFTFVPSGTCGGNITATLSLNDVGGAGPLGTVAFTMQLGATVASTATFSNPAAITILDTPRIGGIAPASPYPSTIAVSGVVDPVSKVTVTLSNMSHTFPADIDILLVGPGGQRLLLMSDVGGGTDAVNATLTFDDSAPAIGATMVSGTFRPTNSGTGDTFPAPAPVGPYPDPQLLSVFNGVNPNGTWSLYAVDDAGIDSGSIAGGWSLSITTAVPVCCDQACTLTCSSDISVPNDPGLCSAVVTYPAPTVAGSCGVVSSAPPSGSTFPVGTTPVTGTATRISDGGVTTCGFQVTVNDVEDPTINVALDPDLLWPPSHQMVDITATVTASDNCGSPSIVLTSISSNELDDAPGNGDGNTVNDVQDAVIGTEDYSWSMRAERDGGGQGRFYVVTYTATDASGNSSSDSASAFVPHDQSGTEDPLSISVAENAQGTFAEWLAVPGSHYYSAIRGNVASIVEETHFINLGAVSCIEARLLDPSTIGREDPAVPALGQVFFYAVAYNDGRSSSYGSVTASKPRVTASGACQ